jgi:hypothetical protein
MHANFQDLLALRGGLPVDAAIRRHVGECTQCTRELAKLSALKGSLQQLPSFEPPARGWAAIQTEVQRGSQRRASRAPLAAFAASVLIAVLVLPLIHRGSGSMLVPAEPGAAALTALVQRSQRLEAVLQVLPPRPHVERAGTSATIDDLQSRIQLVDLQLSAGAKDELAQDQTQQLWNARVELMNSLVHVRYAEAAGNVDRSEQPINLGAL